MPPDAPQQEPAPLFERRPLTEWELLGTAPGAVAAPGELPADGWRPYTAPTTVAAALGGVAAAGDVDAQDWWFRTRVPAGEGRRTVRFEGVATLADVWVDAEHAGHSEDMYVSLEVELPADGGAHEVVVRCAALAPVLNRRHARGRWRTRLVAAQHLRWYRTSLLGRIPAWTEPAPIVGLWRPVELLTGPWRAGWSTFRPRLDGEDGVVEGSVTIDGPALVAAELVVGAERAPLALNEDGAWEGSVRLPTVERWWPHTHGAQPRLPAAIEVVTAEGGWRRHELGRLGFRNLVVERADDHFRLVVNGVPVFARGAVWMPLDPIGMNPGVEALRAALAQVQAAGFNLVRVPGTMAYEEPAFWDLCDELGILVWQDFMFANLDYPAQDEGFAALVRSEAHAVLSAIAWRPALAVLCGGSEIEQQAAMLGLPRDEWIGPLIGEVLPAAVAAGAPETAYVTSTPTGGTFPFHTGAGITHYYGVGAYLRPPADARTAGVRFSAECLAFAVVPEPESVEELLADGEGPGHDPRWKAAVPRDRGTGWDFEDVRDHYVRELFGVEPMVVRYSDPERYLELGRIVVAELLARTMATWRAGDECGGALIYTLRDLVLGAGWGLVDRAGRPKSPYWSLARVCAPVAVLATDDGLDGLGLHVVDDGAAGGRYELEVELWRGGDQQVGTARTTVAVPGRGRVSLRADALFEGFRDLTYAYRFGPPGHDTVVARLLDAGGATASEAVHFPLGLAAPVEPDVGLRATGRLSEAGVPVVTVVTERVARWVTVRAPGYVASDSYFHLTPGRSHEVVLTALGSDDGTPSAEVRAANSAASARATWVRDRSG